MLRVARSAADVRVLSDKLAAAGLAFGETRELRDERRNSAIAWLLDAHKR
jgi:uncharacterized protein YfiM (DUF2279 family)